MRRCHGCQGDQYFLHGACNGHGCARCCHGEVACDVCGGAGVVADRRTLREQRLDSWRRRAPTDAKPCARCGTPVLWRYESAEGKVAVDQHGHRHACAADNKERE